MTDEDKAKAFAIQFGNMPRGKPEGATRVAFSNLGPGGLQPHDISVIQSIRRFLRQWEVDYFGGCEIHVNWKHAPSYHRPQELFFSENLLCPILAHNIHEDNHSPRQQGGTMAMAIGEMATRLHGQGTDPSGLGRWVWQVFRGKDGITTRIYTAYRPCLSQVRQLQTVYAQQKRYFRKRKQPGDKDPCPRAVFLADLQVELQARRLAGERLIVMMDANGDVTSGPIHQMAIDLGLRDSILSHNPHPPFPATHRSGSHPIDIIMSSPEISVLNAAFLAGQDSLGDHRTAIVDFCDTSVLGENMLKIVRPQARRLVCGLPEVRKNYTDRLYSYLQRHRVLEKLHFVQAHRFTNKELPPELSHMMASIDRVREGSMKAAEKRCRKLCVGNVDFSPTMVTLGRRVELFSLIRRRKQGKRVGTRKIRRLAKKVNVTRPLSVSLEEAEELYRQALKDYAAFKPDASVYRYKYLLARKDDTTLPEINRRAVERLLTKEQARKTSRDLR